MLKVVLYELLSLDGVAENPGKFVIDWEEAMDANLARQSLPGRRPAPRPRQHCRQHLTRPAPDLAPDEQFGRRTVLRLRVVQLVAGRDAQPSGPEQGRASRRRPLVPRVSPGNTAESAQGVEHAYC